ncbi:MAG: hypothetical protein DWQ08_07115, partial [Proteobacteria bacterium]
MRHVSTYYRPARVSRAKRATTAVLLAVAFATSAAALGQETQTSLPNAAERLFRHLDRAIYVTPGQGLGPVKIGTPMSAVQRLWGDPLRSDRSGVFNRVTTFVYKAGIDAWIVIKGNERVEEIGIQGRAGFATPEGVRFG